MCQAGLAAGNLYWQNVSPYMDLCVFQPPNSGGWYTDHWEGRQVWPDLTVDYDGFLFSTDSDGTNTFTVRVSGYQLVST